MLQYTSSFNNTQEGDYPELGAIVTAETAEEAASIWHKGRSVHISGAGHNIRRERYEDYMEVITAFLKEVQTI